MRKSKKMTAGILGALTLVMVTGSAMAYFTDSEQAKNHITIGKVDISLTEPNWDKVPDKEKENIVPGKELVKDPTITNTGINDAFVFMKVTVPAAELVTANEDGTKNLTKYNDYKLDNLDKAKDKITYTLNLTLHKTSDNWVLDDLTDVEISKIHGLYAY